LHVYVLQEQKHNIKKHKTLKNKKTVKIRKKHLKNKKKLKKHVFLNFYKKQKMLFFIFFYIYDENSTSANWSWCEYS